MLQNRRLQWPQPPLISKQKRSIFSATRNPGRLANRTRSRGSSAPAPAATANRPSRTKLSLPRPLRYNPAMQKSISALAMFHSRLFRRSTAFALGIATWVSVHAAAQNPSATSGLPSETPARLEPVTDSFDYERRDVMIADARRRQAAYRDRPAERRQGRADSADPHAVRRQRTDQPRAELAPRSDSRRAMTTPPK